MKLYLIVYETKAGGDIDYNWFLTVNDGYLGNDDAFQKVIQFLIEEWGMTPKEAAYEVGEVYVNLVDKVDGYKVSLEKMKEAK